MRPPKIVNPLQATEGVRRQRMYRGTRCPRTRSRVHTVLLSHQGCPPAQIAQITQQSEGTVRRWLKRV